MLIKNASLMFINEFHRSIMKKKRENIMHINNYSKKEKILAKKKRKNY